MNPKEGYLYAVTGKKYVEEAIQSVKRLRKLYPESHVTLIVDEPFEAKEFDEIIVMPYTGGSENLWKFGVLYKALALQLSPYEKTFFVDTDIYFVEDCRELFTLLDYHDLLIAHSPVDETEVILGTGRLKGYHPYNTGLIVYNNNEKTRKLFRDWCGVFEENFDKYYGNQTPFMAALLKNDIKVYVLQSVYNLREPYIVTIPKLKVKIIHGRPDSFEKMAEQLNRTIAHRVWLPYEKKVVVFRIRKSFRRIVRDLLPDFLVEFIRKLKKRNRV